MLLYVLLGRWLAGSGIAAALAGGLVSGKGAAAGFAVVPMGFAAGFVTGSNVGANASLMPVQAALGGVLGWGPLVAPALHNFAGAAGGGDGDRRDVDAVRPGGRGGAAGRSVAAADPLDGVGDAGGDGSDAVVAMSVDSASMDWSKAERHLRRDPVLKPLIKRIGPCGLQPARREPYEALVRGIAHQQVHGRAAEAMLGRLLALDVSATGFPSPRFVLDLPAEALRGVRVLGLQGRGNPRHRGENGGRAGALAGGGGAAGRRGVDRAAGGDQGVGRWTVEMLLMFTLGPAGRAAGGRLRRARGVAGADRSRGAAQAEGAGGGGGGLGAVAQRGGVVPVAGGGRGEAGEGWGEAGLGAVALPTKTLRILAGGPRTALRFGWGLRVWRCYLRQRVWRALGGGWSVASGWDASGGDGAGRTWRSQIWARRLEAGAGRGWGGGSVMAASVFGARGDVPKWSQ
jgi:hypothetical protein